MNKNINYNVIKNDKKLNLITNQTHFNNKLNRKMKKLNNLS